MRRQGRASQQHPELLPVWAGGLRVSGVRSRCCRGGEGEKEDEGGGGEGRCGSGSGLVAGDSGGGGAGEQEREREREVVCCVYGWGHVVSLGRRDLI